ncbi:MAG: DUF4783 domain-containing protein [Ignavibacteriaceae bacterium]
MMKKRFQILLLMGTLGIFSSLLIAQENESTNKTDGRRIQNSALFVFNEIEKGISSGKVAAISKYFSSQTYLNLSNGITGYYSSNQAYYVLEDFFKNCQVTSFDYDAIHADEENPFATGIYRYLFKGKHESAEVYISLKHVGKKWKITQITIN